MSIDNSLDRIIGLVDDSHEAVKEKGGTTATPYLLTNLPNAIKSIPAGEDLSAEITEYGSLNDELEEVINSLPSAGGGGASLETCELTVLGTTSTYYPIQIAYTTVDDSGNIAYANETVNTASKTVTCLQNSIVAVKFNGAVNITGTTEFTSHKLFNDNNIVIFKVENENSLKLENADGRSSGGEND